MTTRSTFPRAARRTARAFLAAAALGAMSLPLASLPADAGVRILVHSSNMLQPNRAPREGEILLQGDRLRMHMPGRVRGKSTVIFRADKDVLWNVAPRQKRYHEIDRETAKKLSKRLVWARNRIAGGMNGMSPEQQAMVGEMLDRIAPVPGEGSPLEDHILKVVETGKKGKVDGRPTRHYKLLRGKTLVGEIWATPWEQVGITAEDYQAFHAMAKFSRDVIATAGRSSGLIPDEPYDAFDRVEGFPVLVRQIKQDAVQTEQRFISLEKRQFDPAIFEIPEDYDQDPPPGLAPGSPGLE